MNKKTIISSFLFLCLFLSGCHNQNTSQNKSAKAEQENNAESTVAKQNRIEIIDFHGSRRCFSCQTIERFTREILEEHFQTELQDKTISFQSINVEEIQNKNLVLKYQARGSSLFINVIQDGQDNIFEETQVWRLVRDEENFKEYLKNKIKDYLN